MNSDHAVELGRDAVTLALTIGAPILLTALCVGLVVSMVQAVTQIQDQTLSFVPKLAALFLVILFIAPWIMEKMVLYATELFTSIPTNL